jgi:hypothetical protein
MGKPLAKVQWDILAATVKALKQALQYGLAHEIQA